MAHNVRMNGISLFFVKYAIKIINKCNHLGFAYNTGIYDNIGTIYCILNVTIVYANFTLNISNINNN